MIAEKGNRPTLFYARHMKKKKVDIAAALAAGGKKPQGAEKHSCDFMSAPFLFWEKFVIIGTLRIKTRGMRAFGEKTCLSHGRREKA